MKKIFVLLLALAIGLSLFACGSQSVNIDVVETDPPPTETAEEETPAEETAESEQPEEVFTLTTAYEDYPDAYALSTADTQTLTELLYNASREETEPIESIALYSLTLDGDSFCFSSETLAEVEANIDGTLYLLTLEAADYQAVMDIFQASLN